MPDGNGVPNDAATEFLPVANQFNAGIGDVIGGYVNAGVQADIEGKQAYVKSIVAMLQDADGKPRPPVDFNTTINGDNGKPVISTNMSVPLVAIVDHTQFLPQTGSITLDMEVSSHAEDLDSLKADIDAEGEAEIGIGPFHAGVKISAKVAVAKEHKRSSDYTARTHAEINMGRQDPPEGLSIIMDAINTTVKTGTEIQKMKAAAAVDADHRNSGGKPPAPSPSGGGGGNGGGGNNPPSQ